MTTLTPRRRRQGGQALIVLALVGMAMFSFGAYAIDQGMSMADRRNLQAVADFAALAGSRSLSSSASAANYVAMQYLAANLTFTIPTTCTATSCAAGSYTPTGSGYTLTLADGTNTLDVSVSHSRRAMLAGVMGFSTVTTASGSRAGTTQAAAAAPACVLCLLDPSSSSALSMTGSGTLTITGGNLAIDSSSSTAATIVGSGSITDSGGSNRVVGNYQVTGTGSFTPAPSTGATSVSDPLSSLTPPVVVGTASSYSLTGSSNATINPGIYSSISVTGSGSLTLNPGIYVLTGQMSITGSGSIDGTGVLLFFGCSLYPVGCTSGQSGGSLSITGSGSFQASAPTASTCSSIPATCSYKGLLIYYDPNNTASMSLVGSGSGPTGTVYGKSSTLNLVGSGGSVNSLIDVDKISITGSGSVSLAYQSSQNYSSSGSSSGSGLLR
jgi:Flp pilus assembly protein TadG